MPFRLFPSLWSIWHSKPSAGENVRGIGERDVAIISTSEQNGSDLTEDIIKIERLLLETYTKSQLLKYSTHYYKGRVVLKSPIEIELISNVGYYIRETLIYVDRLLEHRSTMNKQ